MFKKLKYYFSPKKITKEKINIQKLKEIKNLLLENSDKYVVSWNINVQQILKRLKVKEIKNIWYKEKYFYDILLYNIINLKYIWNIWTGKSTFSYINNFFNFLKTKSSYIFKFKVFSIIMLLNLFLYLFVNIYIAFANYSFKVLNHYISAYPNPYTRTFYLQNLKREYKDAWIDNQTNYLFYYIILFLLVFKGIKKIKEENYFLWWNHYQHFLIIYLTFISLLNKIEDNWKKKDIPFFNIKWVLKEIVIKLKNEKMISLKLFDNIITLLLYNFQIKPKTLDASVYTYFKRLSSIQSIWEKEGFDWTLYQVLDNFDIIQSEIYEKFEKWENLYFNVILVWVVIFYFLFIGLMMTYFLSPVFKI